MIRWIRKYKWDKVFKSGKFCGRQPLKNLLSPLLNTLSQICFQRTLHNIMFYIPRGIYLTNFVHGKPKKHKFIGTNFDGFFKRKITRGKLVMKLLESWSAISVAKLNKSLTMYLLVVNASKIGTKTFAGFYVFAKQAKLV